MAYVKQNFETGQTLTADMLNHIEAGFDAVQDKLVSGTNIKTLNGQSLLGSGNITVEGGSTIVDGSTLGIKYAGFNGKCVSFLGDSITTFCASDGTRWTPSGWVVWYGPSGIGEAGDKLTVSGITDVDKTWWKQVLNTMGMKLCTNASWSGSCVTGNSSDTSGKIGCGDRRIQALASDGVIKSEMPSGTTPDIIVIFMGINDFSLSNYAVGTWDMKSLPSEGAQSAFDTSYALMLKKVMATYPHAEVFCCTLLETTGGYDDTSGWPTNSSSGATLKDYNDKIVAIANLFGANVIDLHACGITYFNIGNFTHDKLHPNASGAKLMAQKVVAEINAKSKFANPLGAAETVYHTVTYKYVDANGNTVNTSTTSSVASGTTLTIATSDAPTVDGYTISTVSHTSVTVTSDITITFTYAPIANVTYYTVTYKYVDAEGNVIKSDTAQSVAEGVTLNLVTSSAPSISGYKVASVSPSGSVTVSEDTVVTYTYNAIVYRTITYAYVDEEGVSVKEATTEQVEEGTTISLDVSNAPSISGYKVSSVSPSGEVQVTSDLTVTYTYLVYVPALGEAIDIGTTLNNTWLSYTDGRTHGLSPWKTTDFIAIPNNAVGVSVTISAYRSGSTCTVPVAFYDANKSYLGGFQPVELTDSESKYVYDVNMDILENASYVRFSWTSESYTHIDSGETMALTTITPHWLV